MNTYQKLVAGREKIRNGWTQGIWFEKGPNGKRVAFCALGALLADTADMSSDIPRDAALALKAELPEKYADCKEWTTVASFNDEVRRTKEEVLALYDRAIAKLAPRSGAEIAKEIMAKPRIPEEAKSEEITT